MFLIAENKETIFFDNVYIYENTKFKKNKNGQSFEIYCVDCTVIVKISESKSKLNFFPISNYLEK